MCSLSLEQRERNEQAAMFRRVDEAIDAELGREYLKRWDFEREAEGYDLYLLGEPISACWCPQMRRGWERAQEEIEAESREERAFRAMQTAQLDAENQFAETSGLGGWHVGEIETTLEDALAAQIECNERRLAENATILIGEW